MKKLNVFVRYFRAQFSLTREEDFEETYAEILEGTRFRGYNFWILGISMVIACVGLNIDATSAVIGAMLISPLMGPIVGFAFGMALNDTDLKKQGISNWLRMTIISLLASTLFFLISPFDNNTVALLSFQKATIFDILLAFFGGLAGFIGILKREGTKVIAGVAVATACMPPLCTAGYGIAHWDFAFFIGGLYFYLINCLFIGVSTFLLARLTGFHQSKKNTPLRKTQVWLWNVFMILMIVPSIYIAYIKWENEQKKREMPKTETDSERLDRLEKRVKTLDSLLLSREK